MIKNLILTIILIGQFPLHAQTLMITQELQDNSLPGLLGQIPMGNQYLTATTLPEHIKGSFQLLPDDLETLKLYIVESRFGLSIDQVPADLDIRGKLLWKDDQNAIYHFDKIPVVPRELIIRKVDFNRLRIEGSDLSLQKPDNMSSKEVIQDIMNSVDSDQLYNLEMDLTGERSISLDGHEYTISSRYSYSPQLSVAEDYITHQLEDYGYQVEKQSFLLATIQDISFVPNDTKFGWFITSNGEIYGTTNSGESWSKQFSDPSGHYLWSIFPISKTQACAVGDSGKIYLTTNGTNWDLIDSPITEFLFGVYFINENTGWICGDNGLVLKTSNGGQEWSIQSTPVNNRFYDVYFTDTSNGWVVGREGKILSTIDGGSHWTEQTSGTSTRLYGVHFINSQTGFAVGWDSTVISTGNSGETWNPVSISASNHFYDIDFLNDTLGAIAGHYSNTIITINGGETWTRLNQSPSTNVYAIDLIDLNTIWEAGNNLITKSNDSGASWTNLADQSALQNLNNIIATKSGTIFPERYYAICAHYDAITSTPMVSAPGADDNASGTAAVLEAARILSSYEFENSIRFLLFPGEEQGLHGSEAFAAKANANKDQIAGVFNMDMIAYDGDSDGSMEIHAGTLSSSQIIGEQLVNNIAGYKLSLQAIYKTGNSSGASDHSSFWKHGFPAVMVIEDFSDFTPYYHTTGDLISTLNFDYFTENAKLVIGTLAQFAKVDTIATNIHVNNKVPAGFHLYAPYPNPFNPTTSIKYEITQASNLSIIVYDINGRRIKNLYTGFASGGKHQLIWNGRDQFNRNCPSGTYFIRMNNGQDFQTRKVLLLR